MVIAEGRERGVNVLAPAGRVDTTTVATLESRLGPLLALPQPRVVIDFTGVDYISSAGLRVLLVAARRVQGSGGGLALCGMGDAVRQVFQLAGFVPLFTITDTRDAAVSRLAP